MLFGKVVVREQTMRLTMDRIWEAASSGSNALQAWYFRVCRFWESPAVGHLAYAPRAHLRPALAVDPLLRETGTRRLLALSPDEVDIPGEQY